MLGCVGRPSKAFLSRLFRTPFLGAAGVLQNEEVIDLLLNESRSENLLWSARRWEGRDRKGGREGKKQGERLRHSMS